MGWTFRKSYKLGGGARLNLSSRGLGISTGVKGFRISSGPRGTRVYGGFGPFRYQQGISSRKRSDSLLNSIPKPQQVMVNTHYEPKKEGLFWNIVRIVIALLFLFDFSSTDKSGGHVWLWIWIIGEFGLLALKLYSQKAYDLYFRSTLTEDPVEKISLLNSAFNLISKCVIFDKKAYCVELAQAQSENADYLGALSTLNLILNSHSTNSLRLDCLLQLNRFDEVIQTLSPYINSEDRSLIMFLSYYMAEAYAGKKEYDRALEWVKKGLNRRGEDIIEEKRQLRLVEANIYKVMGEIKKAKSKVNEILKEIPDYEPALEFQKQLIDVVV